MTVKIAAAKKVIGCKLHQRRINRPIKLAALTEVYSELDCVSILGGNTARANGEDFSYWAAEPKEIFEFAAGESEPFIRLRKILEKYRLTSGQLEDWPAGVFCGGWIGFFGYELGRYIERIPQTTLDDLAMPLIRLCFYDRFICYDHKKDVWRLTALELDDDNESIAEKFAGLEEIIERAEGINVTKPTAVDIEKIDFSKISFNMSKEYYLEALRKTKRYIYDGEVYQINFSQRFESQYKARPIELFHWQNFYNPSPYAAYIDAGDFHIVSASPEMFITINDGIVSTKPIKGTRSRINEIESADRQTNKKNFNELLDSEKEQAELNMIIDLERNDLARICRPGTRKVVQQRTIEAYPSVFHAVATVAGRLRSEITFCDILRAMFPGGSITGAPKISSMKIIDELEPTARGVYTGSIGFIGVDGNACLNIAIRTIIIKNQKAFAQTGGGIVADSEPEAEWDETITKARALLIADSI